MAKCKDCLHFNVCQKYGTTVDFDVDDGVCLYYEKPVVRCKDCVYWNEDALACDNLPWVDSSEHENWYADDFCSYGEKKT